MLSFDPGIDTPDDPFFFFSAVPTKILYARIFSPYVSQNLPVLSFMTPVVSDKDYKFRSPLLRSLPPLSLRFKRLSRRPTFEHLLKIESDLPYILIIHLLLHREQSLFLLQRTIGYLLLVSEIMLVSSKHHIKHIITPFRKCAKTFNVEAAGMYVYIVTAEF